MYRATYDLLGVPGDRTLLPVADTRVDVSDEELAGRSGARLLITANTGGEVETLARRIHGAGRAAEPFVQVPACDLPSDVPALRALCRTLIDRTGKGSLLVTDVEKMPDIPQQNVLDVFDELQGACATTGAIRLISGTTVPLLGRVKAGTFSERLFYRLNLLHVMASGRPRVSRPLPREMMGHGS